MRGELSEHFAMVVEELGAPLVKVPLRPRPLMPGHVRITVEVAGCNFFDSLLMQGRYQLRPNLPFSPGGEVAGVIARTGRGSEYEVGQRVLAVLPFGGFSSQVDVADERVFLLPDGVSAESAVALGTQAQSAHLGLFHRGMLRAGEKVLVHAAAGGTGLCAVQLARAVGAEVYGTASKSEKQELAVSHGCRRCFSSRDESWPKLTKEIAPEGFDLIFDPVGGDLYRESTRLLAWGGRLIVVGFASGDIPSEAMNRVMLKNISLVGLHYGPYFERGPQYLQAAHSDLMRWVQDGDLTPLIGRRYRLEQANEAVETIRSRSSVGKVVMHVGV